VIGRVGDPLRLTITEISRTLRVDRKTVRCYTTAATANELSPGVRLPRLGLLGPHRDWLRQRWDEGIRSTERLYAELRDRCYRGSLPYPAPAHRPAAPRHRGPGTTASATSE
jgi:hypothetical protein